MGSVDVGLLGFDLSLWVSFFFSLMILSIVMGDNFFSKLAQYILVGVALGYLGALTIQHVLRPRLLLPLATAPLAHPSLWVALLLGLLLCIAGIERTITQLAPRTMPLHPLQRLLRRLGVVPAALLIGIGVAVVFIGMLQGTFWPLFWHTAHSGLQWMASPAVAFSSTVTLLLTTATLLYWTVSIDQIVVGQARWVRRLLQGWAAIGKRALWFSAGVLFTRLFAGHLSLLIARIEFLLFGLEKSSLWQWIEGIGRGVAGS